MKNKEIQYAVADYINKVGCPIQLETVRLALDNSFKQDHAELLKEFHGSASNALKFFRA